MQGAYNGKTRHIVCALLKPNCITLASSELAPNMFGASSELASVMEFGFYRFFLVNKDFQYGV